MMFSQEPAVTVGPSTFPGVPQVPVLRGTQGTEVGEVGAGTGGDMVAGDGPGAGGDTALDLKDLVRSPWI